LKKACSLFGIGLHLYSENRQLRASTENAKNDSSESDRQSPYIESEVSNANGVRGGNGDSDGNGSDGRDQWPRDDVDGYGRRFDALTNKQLAAIYSMSKFLGKSSEQTKQYSVEAFGVLPEKLNKKDASSLIGELKEMIDNNPSSSSNFSGSADHVEQSL